MRSGAPDQGLDLPPPPARPTSTRAHHAANPPSTPSALATKPGQAPSAPQSPADARNNPRDRGDKNPSAGVSASPVQGLQAASFRSGGFDPQHGETPALRSRTPPLAA